MRTIICKKCGAKIDATLGICPFCGTTFQVQPEDEAARERDKELEWAMSMDDEPRPGTAGRNAYGDGADGRRPQARSSGPSDAYGQRPDPTGFDRGGFGQDGGYYSDGQRSPQNGDAYDRGPHAPQEGAYGSGSAYGQNDQSSPYGQEPRAGQPGYGQQDGSSASFGIDDIENADNDELFNTRVWRPTDDPDSTRIVGQGRPHTAAPPVSRNEIHRPPRDQENRRPVRDTQAAAAARAQAEEDRRKQEELHKKKLFVTAVAMIAGLTLILSIIGGVFDFGKNTGSQSMPNVIGYKSDTAKNVLGNEPYDLKVELKTESSDKTKDTVIDQSIAEGKKIKKNETVTLTISDGKGTASPDVSDGTEYVTVPDLSGKTYEQASATLKAWNLKIARNDDVYSDQDAGTIVAQNPMKDAKIQKDSLVTVTVSKGQMPPTSPSPTGHTITVTAGKGGSVSPKGTVSVEDGKNQTFTFTPSSGYQVKEVKVDGKSIGAADKYTFPSVTEDHTLYVVFEKADTSTTPTPSAEVPQTSEETVVQP